MAVRSPNSVNPNQLRPSDSTTGSGVVSDAKRSQRSSTSFKPEQFRGATGSGQPLTPIAKNYVNRVADAVEKGKVQDGMRAYSNFGAPVRTAIDNAVADAQEVGAVNTPKEKAHMTAMIAKALNDNRVGGKA